MYKRLVVCCDGTWNTPDQEAPTNVTKLALAIADRDSAGIEQRVFYHVGLGTSRSDRIRGGAFGVGLSRDVRDCYRFIAENFEPGDELFFVGFSRGAFTARSTAGLVRNCGVLRRQYRNRLRQAYSLYRKRQAHPRGIEATLFRRSFSYESRIRFIGVWDTVGALGIPLHGIRFLNRRWQFHDTDLSTTVDRAYQALAIDEKRGPFPPAMWTQQEDAGEQVLEQVWFAGVHSDVGGGYRECSLAEIPLGWIVDRATASGLAVDARHFSLTQPHHADPSVARAIGAYIAPDPLGVLHESRKGFYRLLRPRVRHPGMESAADGTLAACQSVSSSARDRLALPDYARPDLASYLSSGGKVTEV